VIRKILLSHATPPLWRQILSKSMTDFVSSTS
jgi:hypothetical protein